MGDDFAARLGGAGLFDGGSKPLRLAIIVRIQFLRRVAHRFRMAISR